MKTHLLLVVASLALTGPTSLDAAPLAGTKPNIILIMPDDMGWGDMGIHGNPLIQTPNLNRLKGESLSFTDFHVSPTCAPTRSAIMSGRHEFRNGVTHTIFERERMSLDTITLPSVLKTAGYSTGIFGKWHLGDEAEYQPDQRGFDEVYIHGGGGIGQTYAGSCGDFPGNTYHDPALLHNGTIVKEKGYCTDLFFAQAVRWIGEQAKAGTPFFTYLTPNAPHAPYISPGPKYDALYEGKEIDGQKLDAGAVAYYSMITNIDENVGKLLGKLKEWGLEENTLVFFFRTMAALLRNFTVVGSAEARARLTMEGPTPLLSGVGRDTSLPERSVMLLLPTLTSFRPFWNWSALHPRRSSRNSGMGGAWFRCWRIRMPIGLTGPS
ncbi:MAG: sulfatase-like hydrolase/transferase [Verrucomicrobiales bacterium]